MERYTIKQCVKVIQAYYENGRSNQNAGRAFSKKIIFSDEAHFHLSGFVNKQNCRIWANDNPRVIAGKPMHPQRVTVCCGLWAGGIIEPYFSKMSRSGSYCEQMITNFLWPEVEDMDVDDMWFQQDGATCHTANETMTLLREKFDGRMISRRGDVNRPQRSCDMTPLDFFLWGYLKEKVYVDRPATIQELKDEIIRCIIHDLNSVPDSNQILQPPYVIKFYSTRQ